MSDVFDWMHKPSEVSAELDKEAKAKVKSSKEVERRREKLNQSDLMRNRHNAPRWGGAYSKAKPYGSLGKGL